MTPLLDSLEIELVVPDDQIYYNLSAWATKWSHTSHKLIPICEARFCLRPMAFIFLTVLGLTDC